ncbi:hypothetical protein JOB18_025665 [Solea senegalensis]|uniref:Uncharacterized protein n=1 Tax=Solea senegalensis TaxID=28829 RepID=A0AAV6T7C0_SOLSE|nr:hypothetical protein JOB18_025665 [Solea senegalensis]
MLHTRRSQQYSTALPETKRLLWTTIWTLDVSPLKVAEAVESVFLSKIFSTPSELGVLKLWDEVEPNRHKNEPRPFLLITAKDQREHK